MATLKLTPQPETCKEGLWSDAAKQAEDAESKNLFSRIPDIETFLRSCPFKEDKGEFGVRRIPGCIPKQRSTWLKDILKNKIGVNCFERTEIFLAWHIMQSNIQNVQSIYEVMDILITDDLRHVFPLDRRTGSWILLNEGEEVLANSLTGGTGRLQMNPTPQGSSNAQVNDETFANDPMIQGLRNFTQRIRASMPVANASHDEIVKLLKTQYPSEYGIDVINEGTPVYHIPYAAPSPQMHLVRANIDSNAISDALDPLINKASKRITDNIKNERGNIPIETTFKIDPLVLFAAITGLVLVTRRK